MASTKSLDGFVYNLAQKFNLSCEHICRMLNTSEFPEFRADLITGEITPPEFDIRRNRILVDRVRDFYTYTIAPIIGTNCVRAEIILTTSGFKSTTTAEVEDSEGKIWSKAISTA